MLNASPRVWQRVPAAGSWPKITDKLSLDPGASSRISQPAKAISVPGGAFSTGFFSEGDYR